jgi:hypothetical protein
MVAPLVADGHPFRWDALAEVGFRSRHALRQAIRHGTVRPVLRGVYIDAAVELTPLVRARAANLIVAPGVALAGGTAAWIYGIPPMEPNAHLRETPLETVRPAGRAAVRRAGSRGRTALLRDEDLVELEGALVTSPVRTALDLARERDRPDALAYLDALTSAGVVTVDELTASLPSIDGMPWVEQAREMVDLCEPLTESAGESWTRLRALDAGAPRPVVQHWVYDESGIPTYRLDCAIPARKAAFEFDGEVAHGEDRVSDDLRRRTWLEAEGWRMVSFRREHVLGRSHAFEKALGEVLSFEPRLHPWERRRRTYARRRLTVPRATVA